MIRALKFEQAEEVILFYLYQRITRSIVTSWGMTVENIAKSCGAEDVPAKENVSYKGKRFDIKKKVSYTPIIDLRSSSGDLLIS
ncbi:hypothetical protein MWH25_11790 [Natroniella acetigena]|uniref:hypothetical protein n=1 Tax=Natroniella acetigena TaxID=52004 RepID=UPI002009F89C|nr:hypothetical protein [Natroniella acetigena]MCK8828408.1 hypothetical protein [Natroniella acetigena]